MGNADNIPIDFQMNGKVWILLRQMNRILTDIKIYKYIFSQKWRFKE